MKTVYIFDALTRLFIESYVAQESPKEPGEYIYPDNSLLESPVIEPNTWPKEENGAWVTVPDFRGAVYWLPDGSRHEITDIGIQPPTESLLAPPAPSLSQQRAVLLSAIDAERARRWRAGFPVYIGATVKWFHSDEFSLTQHLGLKDKARDHLAASGSMANSIMIGAEAIVWSTMDGSQVAITAQLAFDLVFAAGVQQAEIFAASQLHRAAINSLEDLANYDISAGWPALFGETV